MRERHALRIVRAAARDAKAHAPIESCGLRVLFVHVHRACAAPFDGETDEPSSQTPSHAIGSDEQHFDVPFAEADESRDALCLVADAEQADGGQIAFSDERGDPMSLSERKSCVVRTEASHTRAISS